MGLLATILGRGSVTVIVLSVQLIPQTLEGWEAAGNAERERERLLQVLVAVVHDFKCFMVFHFMHIL